MLPTVQPLRPDLQTRLAALCAETESCLARLQRVLDAQPAFLHTVEVRHIMRRADDGGFHVDRYDLLPQLAGLSAHQKLPLAGDLMALQQGLDAVDRLLISLSTLLQQEAPAFSIGKHAPIFYFSKPILARNGHKGHHLGLHLRSHRERGVDGHTMLGKGMLLRACTLVCRAAGIGKGVLWTYGSDVFSGRGTRMTVRADDPASALAWIFATQDHGILTHHTGIPELLRHEPDTLDLVRALRKA